MPQEVSIAAFPLSHGVVRFRSRFAANRSGETVLRWRQLLDPRPVWPPINASNQTGFN